MRQALAVGLVLAALIAIVGPSAAGLAPARGPVALHGDAAILRTLDALTYGPRPGDLERVQQLGLDAWLEQQLHPDRTDDDTVEALRPLGTLDRSSAELRRDFPPPYEVLRDRIATGTTLQELIKQYPRERLPSRILTELAAAKAVRAVLGEYQLQEVMADFWFNHFNVFSRKGDVRWYATAYEREAIRPHAFGKLSDLVRATARHPAMLYYLDNWVSSRPDTVTWFGRRRRGGAGLNENYARELLELHTLGVDGGYTQRDVTEVARAFTGWTIDRDQGRFVFRRRMHDGGEKIVLGHRIPAGGAEDDGERVIEILVRHPATARFIAGKLAQRFVADTPPPALVDRLAAVYRQTGGDVREMLRALAAAPEFLAAESRGTKIKKPFEFVVSAVRALGGGVDARGGLALARAAAAIGESLYDAAPPTGYADRADEWVGAGALLARMNFALDLVHGRLPGVQVDPVALVGRVDTRDPAQVVDRLLATVLPGRASDATLAVLLAEAGAGRGADGSTEVDVLKAVALVIGSPEFQRR